ncbi:MAG: hypothetical protein CFE32_14030 [Alphaproteobacteria bacterium PA3]|nr:MAG: hypothetical protein CFE32_14030 [Alphaproteobacteria bacterium PA3]
MSAIGPGPVSVRPGVAANTLAPGLASAASARPAPRDGRARDRVDRPRPRRLDEAAKTAFDRTAALAGVILLLPLFVMIAVLIWVRDPGPVLFGHVRIGKGGRSFRCLKFRSMVRDGDRVLAAHLARNPEAAREWDATRKLKSDPRVTTLGAVLRKTSLDELPQLINVLKGDMSLVGPRPIVADEARHYGAAIGDYMAVRPGLTGLWQIGGRSDTSYAERVLLDQTYVQRRSLGLDLWVLLRTVVVVLRGRGSY